LLNPQKVIEKHFNVLKEVLDIVRDKEVLQLLEELVRDRKNSKGLNFENRF